jgi:hypothetical protein
MRLHLLLLLVSLAAGLSGRTALAQITAPIQGGEVGVVDITATTMELTFGTTGTGQGRVVAIAEAPGRMPVMLTAADGRFYKAAPTYAKGDLVGEGYAVYNGTGHSVTVTGLKPNTSYYIANSEYNKDGSTIMYNPYGTSTIQTTSSATSVAPTPLPVELTSFSGTVDKKSMAILHWATASERNTAYFALERSIDGTTFKEAGRVAAAGTSSQSRAYQWPDPQYLTHPTYYRLRQADHDGTVSYSGIITLAPAPSVARLVEVYPNPSTGQTVNLLLQGYDGESFTLRLSDALGRSVLVQALTPAADRFVAALTLPQGLATGTYVLTLAGNNGPIQKRITVSN